MNNLDSFNLRHLGAAIEELDRVEGGGKKRKKPSSSTPSILFSNLLCLADVAELQPGLDQSKRSPSPIREITPLQLAAPEPEQIPIAVAASIEAQEPISTIKNYWAMHDIPVVLRARIQDAFEINENADVFDYQGKLLFGVRYDGSKIMEEQALKKLSLLPQGIDVEMGKENRIEPPLFYTEVFGHPGPKEDLIELKESEESSPIFPAPLKNLAHAIPILKDISKLFQKHWPSTYADHETSMKILGKEKYYLGYGSVFSSLAVTTHQIDKRDHITKNALRGYHLNEDYENNSYSLMQCNVRNIKGGDLFFPHYTPLGPDGSISPLRGIVIKVRDGALVCFKGAEIIYATTPMDRDSLSKESLRVTAVAHMQNFQESHGPNLQRNRIREQMYLDQLLFSRSGWQSL